MARLSSDLEMGCRELIHKSEFVGMAREVGVRDDWHEPDEQGLIAECFGVSFDNAGFADEKKVVFIKDGKRIAWVNLATLCSWAAGTQF